MTSRPWSNKKCIWLIQLSNCPRRSTLTKKLNQLNDLLDPLQSLTWRKPSTISLTFLSIKSSLSNYQAKKKLCMYCQLITWTKYSVNFASPTFNSSFSTFCFKRQLSSSQKVKLLFLKSFLFSPIFFILFNGISAWFTEQASKCKTYAFLLCLSSLE